MHPNRRHGIGGRSARLLAFGAGSVRAMTRWMVRFRPSLLRCVGQLTNACELSMRLYKTDGFSAPPDTSGGCKVG